MEDNEEKKTGEQQSVQQRPSHRLVALFETLLVSLVPISVCRFVCRGT
jgi:hypothetical protein